MVVIKSENVKHLKPLPEQLGEEVGQLTTIQMEDLHLGLLMNKEKTGKTVNRDTVFKLLDKRSENKLIAKRDNKK